jgi:glutamate synthase domain-containing protein 1
LAFLHASNDAGFELPPPGEYDVGMFFMPTDEKCHEKGKTEFKKVGVAHCHQVFPVYIINFLKTIIVFGNVLYSFC